MLASTPAVLTMQPSSASVASGLFDFPSDHLAEVLEMDVARNELGKAVGDGDDGLAEVAVLHASRAPQAAGAGHVSAVGGGAGAVGGHGLASLTFGVGRSSRWV